MVIPHCCAFVHTSKLPSHAACITMDHSMPSYTCPVTMWRLPYSLITVWNCPMKRPSYPHMQCSVWVLFLISGQHVSWKEKEVKIVTPIPTPPFCSSYTTLLIRIAEDSFLCHFPIPFTWIGWEIYNYFSSVLCTTHTVPDHWGLYHWHYQSKQLPHWFLITLIKSIAFSSVCIQLQPKIQQ